MSPEPTEAQKRKVILDLVNEHEIIMLWDSNNNCYRPMWKNEWDVNHEVKTEKEQEIEQEKYQPYIADETDIGLILDDGELEWVDDGDGLHVNIYW